MSQDQGRTGLGSDQKREKDETIGGLGGKMDGIEL